MQRLAKHFPQTTTHFDVIDFISWCFRDSCSALYIQRRLVDAGSGHAIAVSAVTLHPVAVRAASINPYSTASQSDYPISIAGILKKGFGVKVGILSELVTQRASDKDG